MSTFGWRPWNAKRFPLHISTAQYHTIFLLDLQSTVPRRLEPCIYLLSLFFQPLYFATVITIPSNHSHFVLSRRISPCPIIFPPFFFFSTFALCPVYFFPSVSAEQEKKKKAECFLAFKTFWIWACLLHKCQQLRGRKSGRRTDRLQGRYRGTNRQTYLIALDST